VHDAGVVVVATTLALFTPRGLTCYVRRRLHGTTNA
jgi:hypothetical protein